MKAMNITATRYAAATGRVVDWGNIIGHLCGQTGTYTFDTEADAEAFASYARTGFRSLASADLVTAGVPEPVSRGRGD